MRKCVGPLMNVLHVCGNLLGEIYIAFFGQTSNFANNFLFFEIRPIFQDIANSNFKN